MARQLPQRLSREETKDVLEELYKQLPVSMTTCFDNKPFLKPLYDLQSQNLSLALDFSPTQSQSDWYWPTVNMAFHKDKSWILKYFVLDGEENWFSQGH